MPTFLHVGCGQKRQAQTTRGFNQANWHETRLDIDPSVSPDILGNITGMLCDGAKESCALKVGTGATEAFYAAQIALSGVGKSRGPARDGATIFDENSALLVLRDSDAGRALEAALRGHDWRSAFIAQREKFAAGGDAEVWLFGHALMEKLVAPRKAITAHTRVIFADDAYFALDDAARRAWLDARVAQDLVEQGLSTADFTPLPVLGLPG